MRVEAHVDRVPGLAARRRLQRNAEQVVAGHRRDHAVEDDAQRPGGPHRLAARSGGQELHQARASAGRGGDAQAARIDGPDREAALRGAPRLEGVGQEQVLVQVEPGGREEDQRLAPAQRRVRQQDRLDRGERRPRVDLLRRQLGGRVARRLDLRAAQAEVLRQEDLVGGLRLGVGRAVTAGDVVDRARVDRVVRRLARRGRGDPLQRGPGADRGGQLPCGAPDRLGIRHEILRDRHDPPRVGDDLDPHRARGGDLGEPLERLRHAVAHPRVEEVEVGEDDDRRPLVGQAVAQLTGPGPAVAADRVELGPGGDRRRKRAAVEADLELVAGEARDRGPRVAARVDHRHVDLHPADLLLLDERGGEGR